MADKDIERILRERLANHKESPDDSAWELIEKELPKSRIGGGYLVLILLLLISGGVSIFFLSDSSEVEINKNNKGKMITQEESSGQSEISANLGMDSIINELNTADDQKIDLIGSIISQSERMKNENNVDKNSSQVNGEKAKKNSRAIHQLEPSGLFTEKADDLERRTSDFVLKKVYPMGYLFDENEPKIEINVVRLNTEGINHNITHDKEKKSFEERKFTLYFQGMPTLNYNRYEANSRDNQLISDIKRLPSISLDRIGIRLETGLMFDLSPRVDVFGGILFLKQNQVISYITNEVDSLSGVQQGDDVVIVPHYSNEEHKYSYELINIGAQLGLTYKLNSERFNMAVGTGVELHKSIKHKADQGFEMPDKYLFYNIFYRIEYPKEKRFRFMAQPTFNYSINLNKKLDAPFYIKPYGLGLNLGFVFKL
jgi:hypothetical protein